MIDRRRLVMGLAAAAALPPAPAAAAEGCVWPPPQWVQGGFPSRRWANLLYVNTGERFKTIYCDEGRYILSAIKEFSWVCRDFRVNEWTFLDPRLLDILFVLHWKYCQDEIIVYSGYRTPQSNSQLEGAAKNSQHLMGRALDIHLPNIDNIAVALDFRTFVYGGVGMYPMKGFTHIDMGPLRRWVG
jgi:uncharacterized protein YcbK (DUF882 family)